MHLVRHGVEYRCPSEAARKAAKAAGTDLRGIIPPLSQGPDRHGQSGARQFKINNYVSTLVYRKAFVRSGFAMSLRIRRRSLLSAQTTHGPPGWTRRAGTFPRSAQSRSRSYEVPEFLACGIPRE
jgi:hypothetical protein